MSNNMSILAHKTMLNVLNGFGCCVSWAQKKQTVKNYTPSMLYKIIGVFIRVESILRCTLVTNGNLFAYKYVGSWESARVLFVRLSTVYSTFVSVIFNKHIKHYSEYSVTKVSGKLAPKTPWYVWYSGNYTVYKLVFPGFLVKKKIVRYLWVNSWFLDKPTGQGLCGYFHSIFFMLRCFFLFWSLSLQILFKLLLFLPVFKASILLVFTPLFSCTLLYVLLYFSITIVLSLVIPLIVLFYFLSFLYNHFKYFFFLTLTITTVVYLWKLQLLESSLVEDCTGKFKQQVTESSRQPVFNVLTDLELFLNVIYFLVGCLIGYNDMGVVSSFFNHSWIGLNMFVFYSYCFSLFGFVLFFWKNVILSLTVVYVFLLKQLLGLPKHLFSVWFLLNYHTTKDCTFLWEENLKVLFNLPYTLRSGTNFGFFDDIWKNCLNSCVCFANKPNPVYFKSFLYSFLIDYHVYFITIIVAFLIALFSVIQINYFSFCAAGLLFAGFLIFFWGIYTYFDDLFMVSWLKYFLTKLIGFISITLRFFCTNVYNVFSKNQYCYFCFTGYSKLPETSCIDNLSYFFYSFKNKHKIPLLQITNTPFNWYYPNTITLASYEVLGLLHQTTTPDFCCSNHKKNSIPFYDEEVFVIARQWVLLSFISFLKFFFYNDVLCYKQHLICSAIADIPLDFFEFIQESRGSLNHPTANVTIPKRQEYYLMFCLPPTNHITSCYAYAGGYANNGTILTKEYLGLGVLSFFSGLFEYTHNIYGYSVEPLRTYTFDIWPVSVTTFNPFLINTPLKSWLGVLGPIDTGFLIAEWQGIYTNVSRTLIVNPFWTTSVSTIREKIFIIHEAPQPLVDILKHKLHTYTVAKLPNGHRMVLTTTYIPERLIVNAALGLELFYNGYDFISDIPGIKVSGLTKNTQSVFNTYNLAASACFSKKDFVLFFNHFSDNNTAYDIIKMWSHNYNQKKIPINGSGFIVYGFTGFCSKI